MNNMVLIAVDQQALDSLRNSVKASDIEDKNIPFELSILLDDSFDETEKWHLMTVDRLNSLTNCLNYFVSKNNLMSYKHESMFSRLLTFPENETRKLCNKIMELIEVYKKEATEKDETWKYPMKACDSLLKAFTDETDMINLFDYNIFDDFNTGYCGDYNQHMIIVENHVVMYRFEIIADIIENHLEDSYGVTRLSFGLPYKDLGIDFSDTYTNCDNCGMIVRTEPDCHGWRPRYYNDENYNVICEDCRDEDLDSYVEHLTITKDNRDETDVHIDQADIDLTDYGFINQDDDKDVYQVGFYGRNDNPNKILDDVFKKYPNASVIFQLLDKGQFNMDFTVWIKDDDFKADYEREGE